jgi:hypothetical protein
MNVSNYWRMELYMALVTSSHWKTQIPDKKRKLRSRKKSIHIKHGRHSTDRLKGAKNQLQLY